MLIIINVLLIPFILFHHFPTTSPLVTHQFLSFTFLDGVLCSKTFLILIFKLCIFKLFFSLVTQALVIYLSTLLLNPRLQRFTLIFSSKSFIVLVFTFRFFIQVNFACEVKVQLPSFACGYLVISMSFVENTILSLLLMVLSLLSKIS